MTKTEIRVKLVRLERLRDGARMINDHVQVATLTTAIRRLERKLKRAKAASRR